MADYDNFAAAQPDGADPLDRLTSMQTQLAEVVGTGEAADGLITARFTAGEGVTALDVDPRAMRVPSADLAEYLRLAVNNAYDDYRNQIQRISAAAFDDSDARDLINNPKAALSELSRLGDDFAGKLQGLARELGVQQRRAQDAMSRFRPAEE